MKVWFGILLAVFSSAVLAAETTNHSIGLGVGRPYGLSPGIKYEYRFADHFSASLGGNETGPTVGAQIYFRDRDKAWQPRIGVYYGTITLLSTENPDEEYFFQGASVELGQSWLFGEKQQHGFDLGLAYAIGDGGKSKKMEELNVSFGQVIAETLLESMLTMTFGYRYNF